MSKRSNKSKIRIVRGTGRETSANGLYESRSGYEKYDPPEIIAICTNCDIAASKCKGDSHCPRYKAMRLEALGGKKRINKLKQGEARQNG